jgi:hypothetical protein
MEHDEDNCLICLMPMSESKLIIRCPHDHGLHVNCAVRMLAETDRQTCPYCSQPLQILPHLRMRPSLWSRARVVVEHTIYAVLMVCLMMLTVRCHPMPWRLNLSVAKLRWKYERFNIHGEGLVAVRQWVVRMLGCIAAAVVIAVFETVMQDVYGEEFNYASAFVYGVLVVKYGKERD